MIGQILSIAAASAALVFLLVWRRTGISSGVELQEE